MKTFKASTGAEIVIQPASWQDAKMLKRAVELAVGRSTIPLDIATDLSALLPLLARLDGSDEFDAALWPCLIRCTRDKEKITEKTFDDVKARADYYEIVVACVKENLGPLVESLLSQLLAAGVLTVKQAQNPSATPKSE